MSIRRSASSLHGWPRIIIRRSNFRGTEINDSKTSLAPILVIKPIFFDLLAVLHLVEVFAVDCELEVFGHGLTLYMWSHSTLHLS